jgi:hypothetical protein
MPIVELKKGLESLLSPFRVTWVGFSSKSGLFCFLSVLNGFFFYFDILIFKNSLKLTLN